MTFLWMQMLWLLAIVPALIGLYWLLMRRKKKVALRYASLTMVKEAMSAKTSFKRHIPPLLFLVALTLMIVSIARPAAVVTLPSERSTVILAMDVSGSMRATDVDPTRITAAQKAAKEFVEAQPSFTSVGIVAFAATAMLVQSPTHNREDTLAAIDRFQTQRGTAVGSGIMVSLRTIFPDIIFDELAGQSGRKGSPLGGPVEGDKPPAAPVPPGSYKSAVIVLLSDGQTNAGPDPIESARAAADRGVRIFTVGFGTKEGTVLGFGGRSMRVQLDEDTLKKVADMTRGSYFHAGTETDLKTVYRNIATQLVMERQKTEITALFSAAACAVALLSAFLSLLWFNRIA